MASVHEIKALILSCHPLVVVESIEEDRVESLLLSAADELRLGLFSWTSTVGLSSVRFVEPIPGTEMPIGFLAQLRESSTDAIYYLKGFARHLTDPKTIRAFQDVLDAFGRTRATVFLSGESVELPPEIEAEAVHVQLDLPSRAELRGLVRTVIASLKSTMSVDVDLEPDQASALVDSLTGLTMNQARQILAYAIIEDGRLDADDIPRIADRKGRILHDGGLLEFFPTEHNEFDIGGFARLKEWLERTRVGFSAAARRLNLEPPKGVLFVGVQGCGKSLAAKYVARQWRMPLLKLDAARLYDKYIGESERNLRRAISIAESMSPVVLWIDEIEKAFATGGNSENDGGLSRRLLGTFLTWMQEKNENVFVVGTANEIRALPPEFLRKGRFDEIFFTDLPDAAEREEIFRIHLRLRKQDPARFQLATLVESSGGFSGAEIEQAVISSLYRALYRTEPLSTETIVEELTSSVPLSVSRREDVESLREMARGRFVGVK